MKKNSRYNALARALYKVNFLCVKAERLIIVTVLALLIAMVVMIVVCRYALYIATPWADEMSRFLLIWLVYLGASYAVFDQSHISIDMMDHLLRKIFREPEKVLLVLKKLSCCIIAAFMAVYLKVYIDYLSVVAQQGQLSSAMKINMVIPMLSVAVGSALMILHALSLALLPNSMTEQTDIEEDEAK